MEIKYLTLQQVSKLRLGLNTDKVFLEGPKKLIRIGNIINGKINLNNVIYFQEKEKTKDLNKYLIKENDIVIATRGEGSGKVAIGDGNEEIYFNSNICLLETNKDLIVNRYLYHYLLKKEFLIKSLSHKTAVKMLNTERLKQLVIPIPSLEKQKKIANQLDRFLKLSEELKEELILRKKQYEYYRDEILSFKQDNKIKWLTLGEITNKTYKGIYFSKDLVLKEGEPCVRYVQLYEEKRIHFDYCTLYLNKSDFKSVKYCEYGDLLLTATSRNVPGIAKACAYLNKQSAIIDSEIMVIRHKQNAKYLAHLLSTKNFRKHIKLSATSCLLHITFDSIKDIKIPIPSLEQQQEIASLLDKFWELSNSIKDGLPAEILLRKQQYECYRDRLLI